MTAMFLYDYLLTLPREVEVMWPRVFRLSNAIYFTLRYIPAVYITYAVIATPVRQVTDSLFPLSTVWLIKPQ